MKNITISILGLIILMSLAGPVKAGPIGLRLPDTTATEHDTIRIPVWVDSSMTGENVVAYQVEISHNPSYLEFIDLDTSGSMSAGWGEISFSSSPSEGHLAIAGAGAEPLQGKGALVRLVFYVKKPGSSTLRFDPEGATFLNEGSPPVITQGGSLSISALPTVSVTPNTGLLTTGETLQFNVSGGTAPYSWGITNDSVATIDQASGLLTAEKRGFTRVVATDRNGISDTTDGDIEVRAVALSLRDTSGWQGTTVRMPLYSSQLSGLNIVSGQVSLTYRDNLLQATGWSNAGTLLEDCPNINMHTSESGKTTFSFAGTSPLSGSGILLYIDFKLNHMNSGSSNIEVQSGRFNQNILFTSKAARVEVMPLPELEINPQTGQMMAGGTLQFSVANGTPPYNWSSSDTTIATINENGLLTAHRGGVLTVKAADALGATGTTEEIVIYSTQISLPDTSLKIAKTSTIPISIGGFPKGEGILSLDMSLLYDTAALLIKEVNAAGRTENWMVAYQSSNGTLKIASAGSDTLTHPGLLLQLDVYVKEQVTPDQTTPLEFDQIMLNEGFPMAQSKNGSITFLPSTSVRDVAVAAIDYPESACELSARETLTASVENTGDQTIAAGENIPVVLTVNEGNPIRQTYTLNNNFQPGYQLIADFDQTIDLSHPQDYRLQVYTELTGDEIPENDTLEKTIQVYGLPEVDLGADTITTADLPVLLDAGEGYALYEWQDGSQGQTYSATDYGLYWVRVTDENGCTNTDSVYIQAVSDIGVAHFYEPSSACALSDTEYVRVRVKNYGPAPLKEGDHFPIVLIMNQVDTIEETHTTIRDVASGDSLNHRFAPKLDFSSTGDHNLTAYTCWSQDISPTNDTSKTLVQVFGYPDVDLGDDTLETEAFPYTLDAGSGYALYEWQDGSQEQTFEATQAGWYWVSVTDEHGCSATDSVYISEIVGIKTTQPNPAFHVYPNPSRGHLKVLLYDCSGTGRMEVFNMLGEMVYRRKIPSNPPSQMQIDLSSIGSGVYLMRIFHRGGISSTKIILK